MSDQDRRIPLIGEWYQAYLEDEDAAAFTLKVTSRYTVNTLERLAQSGENLDRRAAVLALGFIGDYDANHTLGTALRDSDRTVRLLAENGIRSVWCRDGGPDDQQRLGIVIQLNYSQQFDRALVQATQLLADAPWFAEAWNQRAISYYSQGRYKDSIADCRQALEINPYHFGAAAGMGQCYLRLADRDSALEAFHCALKLNPGLEGVRATVSYLERARKNEAQ